MTTFIMDTPKERVYNYPSKEDELKFRLYWQMGFIVELEPKQPISNPQKSIENYLKRFNK